MAHPQNSHITKSPSSKTISSTTAPLRKRGKALPIDAAPPGTSSAAEHIAMPLVTSGALDVSRSTQPAPSNNAERNAIGAALPDADFDVGYKKPPKHSQFKKGQSGNPKGRAKGTRNTRTIFEEESQKQVIVTENGKTRKLTKHQLVMMAIINKAAKGDDKAQLKYLKLDERFSQGADGGSGAAITSQQTMAELTTDDKLILERYKSLMGSKPTVDEANNDTDGDADS